MISLTSRSFRICDRSRPVFGAFLRPNSISGVRFASLTSAIERGKRRSVAVEERGGRSFGGSKRPWEERGKRSSEGSDKRSREGRDKRSFEGSSKKPWEERGKRSFEGNDKRSREERGKRSFEGNDKRSREERGKRSFEGSSKKPWEERGKRSFEGNDKRSWEERGKSTSYSPHKESSRQWDQSPPRSRSQQPGFHLDEDEFIRTGKMRQKAKETAIREDRQDEEPEKEIPWIKREGHKDTLRKLKHGRNHHRYTNEFPERVKSQVLVPSSIPYTTAASVFVYGASAVEAALRCSRRKLYKLYIYQAEGEELTTQQNLLRKMALAQGVTVKMAFASWDTMMTKMSDGRPHNGFVLEASPLPTLPIASLEPVTDPTANVFHVKLNPQSEEEAKVNGSSNEVQRAERYDEAARSRFPLILLVDGIVDPGNIGAIIRSAYYLGVDGIVYAGRNSAPMSPVTAKASAGATESMTFLKTVNPQEFVQASRKNGWRFLAADSPRNVFERSSDVISVDRAAGTNTTSLLTEAPTVLMLGNEGTGLMERLKVRADGLISIPGAHFRHQEGILNDAAGVDSLNVSVAAAMLIEMLMRTPLQVTDLPALERQEKEKEKEKETPPPSEAQEAVPQEVAPQSFDFN